jgi:hypothetical protein
MTSKNLSAKEFCKGNFLIGFVFLLKIREIFANAINDTLEKYNISSKDIILIGRFI